MGQQHHRGTTLGEYLRAKRSTLTPQDVGLAPGVRRRRVPGLRREELAQLAGISVDYYTRLEQGRMNGASDAVLDGIARALRLTADERDYLLAAATSPVAPAPVTDEASPRPNALLDAVATPAIALDPRMDIVGWNSLGSALFVDFAAVPPQRRNLARLVFADQRVRDRYVDWASVAGTLVAQLRMSAIGLSGDPRLSALVGELRERDGDFRRWWERHDVRAVTAGRKRIAHPVAGEMLLEWRALRVLSAPEQTIVVHTAVDEAGRRGFRRLAASVAAADRGPR